ASRSSWLQPLSDCGSQAPAKLAASHGTGFQRDTAEPQDRSAIGMGPSGATVGIGQEARQFCFQPFEQRLAIAGVESLQNQMIDGHADAAHTHPRISLSASGRSIFCASSRAAASRCAIWTGFSSAAARNAAFNAILRILPPATLS